MAKKVIPRETRAMMDEVCAAIPHLLRLPKRKVWSDYDEEADVLYLSPQRPQRATDSEYVDEEGIILSYRGKELVGITVLDASKRGAAPSG